MKRVSALALLALLLAAAWRLRSGGEPPAAIHPAAAGAAAGRTDWVDIARGTHRDVQRDAAADGRTAPMPPAQAQIDQRAFAAVHDAASVLMEANGTPDITRSALREQVERLATEVSAARARARTAAERQMVGFYAEAVAAYRDGLQFWELRRFADRPGQSDALDALAAKYGIEPSARISYTASWQSYPNAFAAIWSAGTAAAAKGHALYRP